MGRQDFATWAPWASRSSSVHIAGHAAHWSGKGGNAKESSTSARAQRLEMPSMDTFAHDSSAASSVESCEVVAEPPWSLTPRTSPATSKLQPLPGGSEGETATARTAPGAPAAVEGTCVYSKMAGKECVLAGTART